MDIVFNKKIRRWEVFSAERSAERNGKKQPVFVSDSFQACAAYVDRVRAKK